MLTSSEERDLLFQANVERLSEMAQRAVSKGHDNESVVMILINVDDPNWTDLADHLVPNENWQAFRDRGEIPVARGSVLSEIRDFIAEMVPDVGPALYGELPEGSFRAIVLGSGGASVYFIKPLV